MWSYHLWNVTKKEKFYDVSIFVIFNRYSLANALIMKLVQVIEPVKWSLLIYSFLPYLLFNFRFGCVALPCPKINQKCKNLVMSTFFYSSVDPVRPMLWSWNLVGWQNLLNGVCWYIICCHSPSNFCWHHQKSAKIRVLLKSLFHKNKTSVLCFVKKDMIANKMFFQNIYRLHAFWLGCVVLSHPKIYQKYNILMMSGFLGQL